MQCQLIAARAAVSRLSHRRDRGLVSDKYAWDLWWTKRHQDRLFSEYFEPSPVSF